MNYFTRILNTEACRFSLLPLIFISLFTVTSCHRTLVSSVAESTLIPIDHSLKTDAHVEEFITPYRDSLSAVMNTLVIKSTGVFERNTPEGALGNLVSDIALEEANRVLKAQQLPAADFAILNNGGLRNSLPHGEIMVSHIFELMPFENELVVLELSHKEMAELVAYVKKLGGIPVAGINFTLSGEGLAEVKVNGAAFTTDKHYRVITTDYLANGGDHMDFLKELPRTNLSIKLRDAILQNLQRRHKKGATISPVLEGRIKS